MAVKPQHFLPHLSPSGRGRKQAKRRFRVRGDGPIERPSPLTPTLSPWERERAATKLKFRKPQIDQHAITTPPASVRHSAEKSARAVATIGPA